MLLAVSPEDAIEGSTPIEALLAMDPLLFRNTTRPVKVLELQLAQYILPHTLQWCFLEKKLKGCLQSGAMQSTT